MEQQRLVCQGQQLTVDDLRTIGEIMDSARAQKDDEDEPIVFHLLLRS